MRCSSLFGFAIHRAEKEVAKEVAKETAKQPVEDVPVEVIEEPKAEE